MSKKDTHQQYFTHYSESDAQLSLTLVSQTYHHVVIIPAAHETADFIPRLPNTPHYRYLVILVINSSEVQSPQVNLLHQYLSSNFECTQTLSHLSMWHSPCYTFDILSIDRYSTSTLTLPSRQGVGRARKIAADTACLLIDQKRILSPWINSTDADTQLPHDYFDVLSSIPKQFIAAHFPFKHVSKETPIISTAMNLYEVFISYYVLGLQWAQSPYAHPSLGSCLSIHFDAYIKVRGFPKRSAGEDFYVLNKLRKLGEIYKGPLPIILIEERDSTRTPYGTGPAVRDISQLSDPIEEYLFYHPFVFTYLKELLQTINQLEREHTQDFKLNFLHCESHINTEIFITAIEHIGLIDALNKIKKNCRTQHQFSHQIFLWLDGLKTLQFIHCLEKNPVLSRINIKKLNHINHPLITMIKQANTPI
jgi:hypothetical protein